MRAPIVAGVVLLALVCSACGGSDDARARAVVKAYGDRRHGATTSSPLAAFFGYDDPEKISATSREQNKKAELRIATCMKAEGFDYIPNIASTDVAMATDDTDLTERQYAARWGYGITTTLAADGSTVDGAPGSSVQQDAPSTDPNEAIVAAMGESERRAYESALYGASYNDDGSGDSSTDDAPSGCQSTAYGDDEPSATSKKLQRLSSDLYKRIAADTRVKAAAKEYRSCMSAVGYPKVKSPDNGAVSLVEEKMQKLWASMKPPTGSTDGGDGTSSSDPTDATPVFDAALLASTQEFERRLAVAELDCRAAYTTVSEDVGAEYEQAFIDKNRGLLQQAKQEGLS
ncbi:MAG: hypothetical protein U0Q22_05750 [Acidimicrobiales bacterium]